MITERQWNKKTIDGYIEWYKEQGYDVVVSLNCKRGITRDKLIEKARVLWNKIDCKAYGKANVKRRGMRLNRVCMLDGGLMAADEKKTVNIINKVQVRKEIANTDIRDIDIKYGEAKEAYNNNANLHYHCSIKSAGSFENAQSLVDEIKMLWEASGIDGAYSMIEIYDDKKGNGWLWYIANKAYNGMECTETTTIDKYKGSS
jgi:hypothetical protein